MKKLSEVEIFVKMLEHSEEVFRTIPVEGYTHIKFIKRNINFIFDEKGMFTRIVKINRIDL